VTVTEFKRLDSGDRSVVELEALPLPRDRVDTKQVADGHRIRSGVSDERDALVRTVKVPHRKWPTGPHTTPLCHETIDTRNDSVGELPHRLPSFETRPALK
jgi:hypothetical protein